MFRRYSQVIIVPFVLQILISLFWLQIRTSAQSGVEENDSTPQKWVRIVQISDVQLGFTYARVLQDSANKHTNENIIDPDIDEKYFEQALDKINKLVPKPDVIVSTGDMVNDPGNLDQWDKYLKISDKIVVPHYEVMGNHDGWSKAGIEAFRSRFGHNDYYSFRIKNCLFSVLNSWYLKFPAINPEETARQREFLTGVLGKDSSSAFRIILLHYPVYQSSPDEPDAYFNLPPDQRRWLLDVAQKYRVKLILTGHSHNNNLVVYRDSVTIITTGPVSEPLGLNSDSSPSVRGFRIIDINTESGQFTHEFIPLDGQPFSVLCLGDTHFDKPEHHDMTWVLKEHPADTAQIRQYCQKTATVLPGLYKDIHDLAVKEGDRISLVVQTGDFTEGLCGSYTLARNQLNDFIAFVTPYVKVPYLLAKGNHDITGPGADSAYHDVIFPFISKEAGKIINDSKYVYTRGNAVFFFYDSYAGSSLDWLEQELKKQEQAKFKFVIMHEPVVPFNPRSKWFEFSQPGERKDRERLLNVLGNNRVIVLAGHLHRYGLVIRKTRHGEFLQLSVSSVPESLYQEPDEILSGTGAYNVGLLNLEPGFSPNDREERAKILMREKRFIRYFEYANLQGYVVLKINENRVIADLYSGTGLNKWKSIDLTQMMKEAVLR